MYIRLNLRQFANIGCEELKQFTGVFSSMGMIIVVMFVILIASQGPQSIHKVWHICFDLGRFFNGQTTQQPRSLQPNHALVKYNFLSWNIF